MPTVFQALCKSSLIKFTSHNNPLQSISWVRGLRHEEGENVLKVTAPIAATLGLDSRSFGGISSHFLKGGVDPGN